MKSWQHLLQEVCKGKKECKNKKHENNAMRSQHQELQKVALKRKNTRTTNSKQCNEQTTITIARNAHHKSINNNNLK